ncbi:CobW family GTP-binding protein [Burkholderia multivorans]|uniref:CobW family GTP-binding protein n=1 Tax=Burkholderia multivorans TaxID=87883 RepID=UPI0021BDF1E6|nr:GTP-binding protein [Burkholderia multivorans]MDR8761982.1 putative GTP-binding protein YjiA [Burkholderia multivorans]MDR8766217.1 putative GTP-binding protein YjiA [Burkholderia multivorans]MDR8769996.1 putative GTP-binding protein YjiA [Burkholderia multivorans]MDR8792049.1 putative GTP-binding protein YjiA [Burkholderia multivorans]MDR8794550.1 putative GTP-binding protein YjiA [Burkholderia multivorans]
MDLIPVTLLTGFLGSGKTTVLNRLVQQPEMADALVLINEFGEVGLDHLLVAHSREDVVVEMSNGCLCCTIRKDLARTLKDVHRRFARGGRRRFNRVVIETTGLADPAPIVHTLATHRDLRDRYRLDGMVTTIDARNGEATLDHVEAVKQAAMADRLLITKTDLVESDALGRLTGRLQTINPGAGRILVSHGDVSASRILDLGLFTTDGKIGDVRRWLNEERYRDDDHSHPHAHHAHQHEEAHAHEAGHSHGDDHEHETHANERAAHEDEDHHEHDVNRHDDEIRAFCFTIEDPVPDRVLTEWLDMLLSLMGPSMLRIKGILNVKGVDRPVVIHGVQHVFHPPVELNAWPDEDRRSRIVFITRAVGRETIEETFRLFSEVAAIRAEKLGSS